MSGRLTETRLAEIEKAGVAWVRSTDLDRLISEVRESRAALAREQALREALGNLFGDLYLHHLGEITDAQLWASGDRAETRVRIALGDSGGDPVEVRPSESRAGSQAGLNGPGGSPTSPPGRDLDSTPGETKEPA